MTRQMQEMALAMAGGMPVARAELSLSQWHALGILRKREEVGRML